ncbi:MAG: matrixin family metalloprotease [Planctomycetota bacterium]
MSSFWSSFWSSFHANRRLLILGLSVGVLFFSVSCQIDPPARVPTVGFDDFYDGPAFVYPFSVLSRVAGADGILWQHDRTDCPFDVDRAERIIEKALAEWNFPGICSFRRAETDEEATLTIGWRQPEHGNSCYRFGLGGALVAHRVSSPRSGDSTPLSIHLNLAVPWDLVAETKEDAEIKTTRNKPLGLRTRETPRPVLESVIVHESGHVLGLGHTVQSGSVMKALQGEAAERPGLCDVLGIQSLYGGGDAVGPADLQILCVAPDGALHLAAPVIRGLAPMDRVRVHAADLDGDDRSELLLLGRGRPADGTGLLILSFGNGALLEQTLGPFPGALDGNRPLAIGRTYSGDAVLAQPVGQKGRYHGILLPAGRPPMKLLPREMSWASVAGGGGDENGDGIIDTVITGIASVREADLDGDGLVERILRGESGD